MTGQPTGGKPINLSQLQNELATAGVAANGLGSHEDLVYTYDADGGTVDFPTDDQPTVDQVIDAHVGMRDKTDAEYAVEFQDAATSPERKQEIRDQQNGLLPREQVPMETDVP